MTIYKLKNIKIGDLFLTGTRGLIITKYCEAKLLYDKTYPL